MKYDFDTVVDRRNTHSCKWDRAKEDIFPMWVADMDFEVAQPIKDALVKRAEHGVFGYSEPQEPYYQAIMNWVKRRNAWQLEREWIVHSPGVVPAMNMLVRALTNPGDKIIVQTPVYYPFFSAIENNGCHIARNALRLENGRYVMDYEDLEDKAGDSRAKVLILCSPHNPVGRVWSREELKRVGDICLRHGVIVISDEIHCDLVHSGNTHTSFATLSGEFEQNSVTCFAPSKTFNTAGLQASAIIIPNKRIRDLYLHELQSNSLMHNPFGIVALEAAYNHGEEWLEQLLDYLQGNIEYLEAFIRERLPEVKLIQPEGTYLVWLDFRAYSLNSAELEKLMLEAGKVWLDEGYIFGHEGEGFERINIACPRVLLQEGLERMERAMSSCTVSQPPATAGAHGITGSE